MAIKMGCRKHGCRSHGCRRHGCRTRGRNSEHLFWARIKGKSEPKMCTQLPCLSGLENRNVQLVNWNRIWFWVCLPLFMLCPVFFQTPSKLLVVWRDNVRQELRLTFWWLLCLLRARDFDPVLSWCCFFVPNHRLLYGVIVTESWAPALSPVHSTLLSPERHTRPGLDLHWAVLWKWQL